MNVELRDIQAHELSDVHALNSQALPHVGDVTLEEVQSLAASAAYSRVAVLDDRVVGFLLGLTPEADYASPNFLWFRARYPSFLYIDRIVIASEMRRQGIGGLFYRDLEAFTAGIAPILACEVNLRPPNRSSLTFHERLGFESVGSQDTEGGAKTVSLLVKSLTPPRAAS